MDAVYCEPFAANKSGNSHRRGGEREVAHRCRAGTDAGQEHLTFP